MKFRKTYMLSAALLLYFEYEQAQLQQFATSNLIGIKKQKSSIKLIENG